MDNYKDYLGCIEKKGSLLIVKKIFFVLVLLTTTIALFAERYQITDIKYDIDGRTKKYALNKVLNIKKDQVIESEEDLKLYIDFIAQKLSDQRVLEDTQVKYELGNPNEQGIIPVT